MEMIVTAVTKECVKNFDKYKISDYTLAKLTTIPFATIESRSRVVSSWGTDEDTDKMICFSDNGWEIVNLVVQIGAGKADVISKDISPVSPDVVVKKVQESSILAQMEFIHKCYDLLMVSEYNSDLY